MKEKHENEIIKSRMESFNSRTINNLEECNSSYLKRMHTFLFWGIDDYLAGEYRIGNSIEFIEFSNVVEQIKNVNIYAFDQTQKIKWLAQYISNMWLFQPFYNGNSRIIYIYLKVLLKHLGYIFTFEFYNNNQVRLPGILALTFFEGEDRYLILEDLLNNNIVFNKQKKKI